MQHSERVKIIEGIMTALIDDLPKEVLTDILWEPLKFYSNDTILKLMGDYAVQRRTAREWLICAQIRFSLKVEEAMNRNV